MLRPKPTVIVTSVLALLCGCSPAYETPEARYAATVQARAAYENGDLRQARRVLRALAGSSRDATAWANLGLAQRRAGKLDAAMRSWTRAVEIDRGAAAAHYWLGVTRLAQGRELLEHAATDAKHGAERDAEARTLLQNAVRDLEAAAGADPAEPLIHATLADAYDALGKSAPAQRARDEAARLDPARRGSLGNSGLEMLRLPARPRPTTAGQIPMHFEAETLALRAERVYASGADGGEDAGLLVAPSGVLLRRETTAEAPAWRDRGRIGSGDIVLSTRADIDGDGRTDLVLFTAEPAPADGATGPGVDSPVEAGGGRSRPATPAATTRGGSVAPPTGRPLRGYWVPAGGTPSFIGELPEGATLLCAADVDHDGDSDLILAGLAKPAVQVWRNDGGRFATSDATPAGIDALPGLRDLVGADFDGDGRTDLVAVDRAGRLRVLVQRAAGSFTTVTDIAGLYLERARTLSAADMDGDGTTDLVLGNDAGLWVLANRGMARFSRQAAYSTPQTNWGAEPAPPVPVVGLVVTDLDNDGNRDVVTLHPADPTTPGLMLARALPALPKPAPKPAGTAKAAVEDTSPEPPLVGAPAAVRLRAWRNDGRGVLLDATEGLGLAADTLRCELPAIVDLDRDGDRDLAWVRTDSMVVVLWNEGGNANRRLLLTLGGSRGARDAAGARLEMHAGGLVCSDEITTQPVWLGIRDRSRLDVVRVRWADGSIQNWLHVEVPADGRLQLGRARSSP